MEIGPSTSTVHRYHRCLPISYSLHLKQSLRKSSISLDHTMTISTDKLNNSQILKLFLIAALLIITPFLSASLRSTYLYFIVNILIVVVGAEAGLLSFFSSTSPQNNKPHAIISELSPHHKENTTSDQCSNIVIMKCSSDKIVGEERQKVTTIEKSPSTPSIFFIGGEDQSFEDVNGDEREEVAGEVSGQELFQKAETFIGNFYKQLKMQREDSWKKLHDIYHKAF